MFTEQYHCYNQVDCLLFAVYARMHGLSAPTELVQVKDVFNMLSLYNLKNNNDISTQSFDLLQMFRISMETMKISTVKFLLYVF